MPSTATWPERVRKIRKDRGLTQQQFAELLRVHIQTIRVWENGLGEPLGPAEIILEQLERGETIEP